jgi:hypothetical protein
MLGGAAPASNGEATEPVAKPEPSKKESSRRQPTAASE